MNFIFGKRETNKQRYFNLIKNQLKECDQSECLMTSKNEIKFSSGSEKCFELSVNKEYCENIIIANISKKEVTISLEKEAKNSSKFSLATTPSSLQLKPNEAHEFVIKVTPLCTSKINENIIVVVEKKKLPTERQKIHMEFSTKLSNYFDSADIDEREFLCLNEFKDMVWRGYCRGKPAIIEYRTNAPHSRFEREVNVLERMKCPTITYFYGACHLPHHECLLFDVCGLGPMDKIIKEKKIPNEKVRAKICFDIAKALYYMHENGGIHRDVKPENIYGISLEEGMEVNAKLSGFGKARTFCIQWKDKEDFSEEVGTPMYMSPELIQHEKYNTKVDVFAFGITMFQIMSWDLYENKQSLYYTFEQEKCFGNDFISTELREIMEKCLIRELLNRIEMGEVVGLFRKYFESC